jgi:hypothetical protein
LADRSQFRKSFARRRREEILPGDAVFAFQVAQATGFLQAPPAAWEVLDPLQLALPINKVHIHSPATFGS